MPAGSDAFFVIVVTGSDPPTEIDVVADCISLTQP
jgi:hypothetical protein